jgi:hypothetical protein
LPKPKKEYAAHDFARDCQRLVIEVNRHRHPPTLSMDRVEVQQYLRGKGYLKAHTQEKHPSPLSSTSDYWR